MPRIRPRHSRRLQERARLAGERLRDAGQARGALQSLARASEAQASLRLVLATIAARLVDEASLTLPLLAKDMDARAIAAEAIMAPMIVAALEAMAGAIGR